jgi:hypothetical protein
MGTTVEASTGTKLLMEDKGVILRRTTERASFLETASKTGRWLRALSRDGGRITLTLGLVEGQMET